MHTKSLQHAVVRSWAKTALRVCEAAGICMTPCAHANCLVGNINSMLTDLHCAACVALQDMLSDANPMVVANALAAMQEIQEVSGKEVLQITPHTLFKLLAALNECTEWGQVGIKVACCAQYAAATGTPCGSCCMAAMWQLL